MSGGGGVLPLVASLFAGVGLLLMTPAARRPATPGERRPRARERSRAVRCADGPLLLDLVAAVVESGAPPPAAVRAVTGVVREAVGGPPGGPSGHAAVPSEGVLGPEAQVALDRCLSLAERTGAPVAALLRSAADELRRRRRREAALAAARLGVRVVAPLGLCTLPAFALLGVVPVVLSLGADLLG